MARAELGDADRDLELRVGFQPDRRASAEVLREQLVELGSNARLVPLSCLADAWGGDVVDLVVVRWGALEYGAEPWGYLRMIARKAIALGFADEEVDRRLRAIDTEPGRERRRPHYAALEARLLLEGHVLPIGFVTPRPDVALLGRGVTAPRGPLGAVPYSANGPLSVLSRREGRAAPGDGRSR